MLDVWTEAVHYIKRCSAVSPSAGDMAQSLVCNDCGLQLKSVKEATDHNEATGHANFAESEEKVRALEMTPIKPCIKPVIGSFVRTSLQMCCKSIHLASYFSSFTRIDRCIRCMPSTLRPMLGMHMGACIWEHLICIVECLCVIGPQHGLRGM